MLDGDVQLNKTDELVSRAWGHAALALLVASESESEWVKRLLRDEVVKDPVLADKPQLIAEIVDKVLTMLRRAKDEELQAEELRF